jgi:hypothetical protein
MIEMKLFKVSSAYTEFYLNVKRQALISDVKGACELAKVSRNDKMSREIF